MPYKYIEFEVKNGLATLTLNRPKSYNALSPALMDELYEAITTVAHDNEIKALLLTGNGKAFCAGADIARAEWCAIMEGTDICFAPVLDFLEAQQHPHNKIRNTYLQMDGITQPAPAPRFSRTVSEIQFGSRAAGEDTEAVLKEWGIEREV